MGAKITRVDRQINVEGVRDFKTAQARVIPDRLEVVSYACLALASRGRIYIEDAEPNHLASFLEFVEKIGGIYKTDSRGIEFSAKGDLLATQITTSPFPGFSTDWQQPSAVVLCTANGQSIIHETVYTDRLGYTKDLIRMGAQIKVDDACQPNDCRYKNQGHNHVALITGPTKLTGSDSIIPDIRAGMAQVIAALIARGQSQLTGIDHLTRGYDSLLPKLKSLGANIREA